MVRANDDRLCHRLNDNSGKCATQWTLWQWQHIASIAQFGGHEDNPHYWQLQYKQCHQWCQQQLQDNWSFVATSEQFVTHEFAASINVALQQSIAVALCG